MCKIHSFHCWSESKSIIMSPWRIRMEEKIHASRVDIKVIIINLVWDKMRIELNKIFHSSLQNKTNLDRNVKPLTNTFWPSHKLWSYLRHQDGFLEELRELGRECIGISDGLFGDMIIDKKFEGIIFCQQIDSLIWFRVRNYFLNFLDVMRQAFCLFFF